MTGMGRMLVVLSLVTAGQLSFAAQVQFSGTESKAFLETHLSNQRDSSLPSVEINLSIPAMEIDREANGFDKLTVSRLNPSQEWGNPEVLMTGSLIAVPAGHEPQLEVLKIEEKQLEGIRVRPAQQEWRCSGPKGSFAFNSRLYSANSTYPNQWVKLEEVGKMGNVRLVRIALNPIRMEMANQKLLVASEVKVRVNFTQTDRNAAVTSVPQAILETIQASTSNGKALGQWLKSDSRSERMVILTGDEYKATLQPYIAWKQQKGIQVDVVTLTEAGGDKDTLLKYVKQAYDQAAQKPSYFLFVGNKTTMPAFKESTGSGSAASDYRMTLLSGDDDIPDVFYGRFLADNQEELKAQIDRTIAYERTSDSASWYSKGMTIASDEGSNPSDAEYAGQVQAALKAGTYKEVDNFLQGEMTATAENIISALNDGRSWISYFGHGSGTSWGSTNDSFSVSTVETLENVSKLPVIIDVACLNASWMNISKCFGKSWVTQTTDRGHAGAVAYYGGSVSISWHPPAVMSVGIAKRRFEKSLTTMGSTVMAGQLYLIEQMGSTSATKDNMKWYNLFGDPSLAVRTQ